MPRNGYGRATGHTGTVRKDTIMTSLYRKLRHLRHLWRMRTDQHYRYTHALATAHNCHGH